MPRPHGSGCRSTTSVPPRPRATRYAGSASPTTSRLRRRSSAATRRRTSPARRSTSTGEPSLSPDAAPPRDYVHRTGAPPGFKGRHLVIGVVVFVVWFAVMGFVLTHGRDQSSSVDVYSQLPSGFTAGLATKGVAYQGLSPVAPSVQSAALAHVASSANATGGKPLD